ncbi:hypothetical protein CcCBS67573_g03617 [Chytriomyces confervae]|uniref:Transcriptional regulator TACO1-like protein n=1 Tax=Chytriomyces confervae TaxID=246404 RepID=A0A507FFV8_9FUNG|nr:hypothetical protein CcCBS67573_g03617 [Chytriomyces confervae]
MRPLCPPMLSQVRYSGHNRWSQIKRAKGANDVARATQFGKIGGQIVRAIIAGKGETDVSLNMYLAAALAQARAAQMPKSNTETAFKKGIAAVSGSAKGGEETDTVVYEGMSAEGVAVVAIAETTNRNKTFPEVRFCFTKHQGALKSIMFHFEKRSRLVFGNKDGASAKSLDEMLDAALEFDGVEDIGKEIDDGNDSTVELLCNLPSLLSLQKQVLERGFEVKEMDLVAYMPTSKTEPLSEEQAVGFEKLLSDLENQSEVVKVFHNATLPE